MSVLHSPQTATCLWDVCLAFGNNRLLLLQGQGPRHGPQWQPRLGLHLVPGGITGYLRQAVVPHYSHVSSSASSLCPYPLFSLSLSFPHHFFATLSGPQGLGVSEVISGVIQKYMAPAWCHLGHAPCSLACTVLDWWSSQASSYLGSIA